MSESNFHNLSESIRDGILIANARGQHIYANRHAAEQLGYSVDELLKTELKDLADPEAYQILKQRLSDQISGLPVPSTFETVIRRKDGTSFHAEITGFKTNWEGQECDLVIFRDITSQERILNDLQQSKRELSTLMANLPGMVYSCVNDPEWTMVFISEGSIELTGYLPDELIESSTVSYNDIIHNEDRQCVWAIIQEALEEHTTYDISYRITTKSGSVKHVWERGQGIFETDGHLHHLEGFITDITERKLADAELKIKNAELQRLNVEKDKFFSIIAHDLRSPFNTLLGFSELLADNVQQYTLAQIQQMANDMFYSAGNLFKLLENLLEWSRMKRGLISFKPVKCNLSYVIKQNIELHILQAGKKSVSINNIIDPATIVIADLQMLNGIIRNLLSNAIKFSHHGGTVFLESEETKDNNLIISIKDEGIGIPDEMKEKLFALGSESSRKGTDGEPSTGLGLLLCKEYIEKHKGKLWVESEVGKGSTFHFTLPIFNEQAIFSNF